MVKSIKTEKPSSVKKYFLNQHISNNLKGLNIIKYFSKNLPSKPGVYQMESETSVRIAEIEFEDGSIEVIPRANLEMIVT